ncbi:MAG: NFACT RNA binding domain-containing protein [Cyanobacteria bacterium P01_H01_bin.74]
MQQLDSITLHHLACEWDKILPGSKVSKVQHPSAHEFLIAFWGGQTQADSHRNLYIHLNPQLPFVVLVSASFKKQYTLNQFSKPTALCMLLRKHLNGGIVQSVHAIDNERIVNITLRAENELCQQVTLILSLELMGKHTNMILYNKSGQDTGTILAVAHGVSEHMSSYRELAAGLPYCLPPKQSGKKAIQGMAFSAFQHMIAQCPADMTPSSFLNANFLGLGTVVLQQMFKSLAIPDTRNALFSEIFLYENAENSRPDPNSQATPHPFKLLFDALQLISGAIRPDSCDLLEKKPGALQSVDSSNTGYATVPYTQFAIYHAKGPKEVSPEENNPEKASNDGSRDHWIHTETVNAMVSLFFVSNITAKRIAEAQKSLCKQIEQQEKRAREKQNSIHPVASEKMAAWQTNADTILGVMGAKNQLNQAPTSATLRVDEDDRPEDNGQFEIAVNPQFSWLENAQQYYKKIKKAKSKNQHFETLNAVIQQELAFYTDFTQWVMQAETLHDIETLQADWQDWLARPDGFQQAQNLTSSEDPMNRSQNSADKSVKKKNNLKKNVRNNSKFKKGKQLATEILKQQSGILSVETSTGEKVFIGKSATGNDMLVGKLARAHDIWLHVQEMPGSHVVLRADRQAEHFNAVLEEAAMLTVYYSSARYSKNVPVVYTDSRYVKKIPQSYPGHVTYTHEASLFITPDFQQIQALIH